MTEGAGTGRRTRRRRAGRAPATALRDIVGATPSQVGVQGALRARDVNRPSEQDLADAEREVQIVHRNWQPQDPPGPRAS